MAEVIVKRFEELDLNYSEGQRGTEGAAEGAAPEARRGPGVTREEKATKLIHFTARWCPFCPASERAFHLFKEKHPRLQAELVDVDEEVALADRYHIDAVPSDLILGGPRPIHGACYDLDEFEVFWRNATEKPEKQMPAKKTAKKPVKKTVAKKTVAKKPARKAVRAAKKPAAKKAR